MRTGTAFNLIGGAAQLTFPKTVPRASCCLSRRNDGLCQLSPSARFEELGEGRAAASDSLIAMDMALTALIGSVAGRILAWVKSYVDYLGTTKRELCVAALGCRNRLTKVDHALSALHDETRRRAQETDWRRALESLAKDDWRRQTDDDEIADLGAI